MDFDMSGTISQSYDPWNLYLENITVETRKTYEAFRFEVQWMYPEAFLETTGYVNNIVGTLDETSDYETHRPVILDYTGPGNITATNIGKFSF